MDKLDNKEIEFEGGCEVDIQLDSLRAIFKKIPNWKTSGHEAYMDSGFKNSRPPMKDWAYKKPRIQTDEVKNYPDPERPKKKHFLQL